MKAIQVTEFGGPEVLHLTDVPDPAPTEGLVVAEVTGIGVNYADTHQAENSYLSAAELPMIPGGEIVGTLPDGRRIVALVQNGYAEKALVAPPMAFDVPEGVTDGQALSTLVQGATAWHLLKTSSRMQEGESVVVHAGAGGVGTIAIQLAKRWGAGRVIATASSDEKRQLTQDLGADFAIDANADDLNAAIREANDGNKVDIVLEMVGGSAFDASLKALDRFGRLVTFGQASRESPTPLDPGALMVGSKSVIGFWLMDCIIDPQRLLGEPIQELLGLIAAGDLKPVTGETYALADARKAHEDLRSRKSKGKLVLDPRL
jgi:NADPH2:quinone reductase